MPKSYFCPECQKSIIRKSSRDKHHLFRHRETSKSRTRTLLNQSFQCPFCENKVSSFKSRKDLVSHIDASHLENLKYSLHKTALGFSSKFKKIKDLNQQHHFFKITKIQGFLIFGLDCCRSKKRFNRSTSIAKNVCYDSDQNSRGKNMNKLATINNVLSTRPKIPP